MWNFGSFGRTYHIPLRGLHMAGGAAALTRRISRFTAHHKRRIGEMMVTEQRLEKVVGRTKRGRGESTDVPLQWRVLESGVLAVKTPLEVVTTEGKRCIWFEPRKKRLVCPHGWGQYHLGIWNGPRAADFPKPTWTTCDCKTATGLCARKKLREEVVSDAPAPSYYDTLVAAQGTAELRPGLLGVRVPGVVGADGGAFYMVDDPPCRTIGPHGNAPCPPRSDGWCASWASDSI